MEEIKVKATKDGMKTAMDRLEIFLEKAHCPVKEKMECMIALEELLVNIVHYAYTHEEEGEIQIFYEVIQQIPGNQNMQIILKDQGKAYNPLKKEDPDITLTAKRRKIGGLGIFMAKNLLDALSYEREAENNVLYLEKHFTSF